MATPIESKQPSPELFFQTMSAYQRTASLKAGIELDLFTKIGEGANTVAPLAQKCQASERGIRILSDYLVIAGFLTKEGNRYGLTLDSATFLDRRSPAYIGSATKFLADPALTDHFKDLAAVVRRGGPAEGEGTLAPDNPIWVEFARAMGSLQSMPASVLAKFLGADSRAGWKVLDIAAGRLFVGDKMLAKQILEILQVRIVTAGFGERTLLFPCRIKLLNCIPFSKECFPVLFRLSWRGGSRSISVYAQLRESWSSI